MCRAIDCPDCGGATWEGCGDHVEQVLRNYPPHALCQCYGRLQ